MAARRRARARPRRRRPGSIDRAAALASHERRRHRIGDALGPRARPAEVGPTLAQGADRCRRDSRSDLGRILRQRSPLRAPVHRRMDRPPRRAGGARRADRLVALQGARRARRHRARPPSCPGARRRRQRRPAARRHVPGACQRARRIPGDARAQRLDPPLDAPEGAQRRHPRRSLDGPARCRRDCRRQQRRHPARPRLLGPRLLPQGARRPRHGRALRHAAAENRHQLVHGRLRAFDLHAERRLRRRGRRRAGARVLQGADALGAVRARHVGVARPRRRQGLRDDARGPAPGRGRIATGDRGDGAKARRGRVGDARSSSARSAARTSSA